MPTNKKYTRKMRRLNFTQGNPYRVWLMNADAIAHTPVGFNGVGIAIVSGIAQFGAQAFDMGVHRALKTGFGFIPHFIH